MNKFDEEMPESEEELDTKLEELKQDFFLLSEKNAPATQVNMLRNQVARLEAWRKKLKK
ncbi:MAG: hypothetical protein WCD76_12985 [Pyrinomonadaceae bacterium]